eukprot:gene7371-biopygen2845
MGHHAGEVQGGERPEARGGGEEERLPAALRGALPFSLRPPQHAPAALRAAPAAAHPHAGQKGGQLHLRGDAARTPAWKWERDVRRRAAQRTVRMTG